MPSDVNIKKNFVKMTRLFHLFSFSIFSSVALSQSHFEKPGHYVVVGAFAIQQNAVDFVQFVQRSGDDCHYRFNSERNIYYVFTTYSEDIAVCRASLERTRLNLVFGDAWIFHYLTESDPIVKSSQIPDEKVKQSIVDNTEVVITNVIAEAARKSELALVQEVFLSLYNPTNDKIVDGVVSIVDTENNRLMQKAVGNSYLTLPKPTSKSEKMTLICDALGYRKIQHIIFYNNLINDSSSAFVEDVGTALMIKFELIKYVKGDVRTLYDVYFHNDADTMLPESRYELSLLKKMMVENPNCKILLHGHTNGNRFGRIIARVDGEDLFSIPKHPRLLAGTAKKLSAMRAETIKDYLITVGIDESRIKVKGWGGLRSLYDKHSANAKRNVRVDVEIVDN
jgi:outer membrane protein OmpA-like peptidoglycan-associated protein